MSRGDKRERDRAKAQAKQQQKVKADGKAGDPQRRNENDAAALQAKVAAKQQQAPAPLVGTSGAPVVPKKAAPSNQSTVRMEDLLNAGLVMAKSKSIKS